jgi:hypothetical protein
MTDEIQGSYFQETARRVLDESRLVAPPKKADVTTAAIQLCREFTTLIAEYGLTVEEEPGKGFKAEVRIPDFLTPIRLWVDEDGAIFFEKVAHKARVPVRYSRRSKQLEGIEDDPYVVPVPGTLKPRRAALEVMVSVLTVVHAVPAE